MKAQWSPKPTPIPQKMRRAPRLCVSSCTWHSLLVDMQVGSCPILSAESCIVCTSCEVHATSSKGSSPMNKVASVFLVAAWKIAPMMNALPAIIMDLHVEPAQSLIRNWTNWQFLETFAELASCVEQSLIWH